jgi:hypothetical protein
VRSDTGLARNTRATDQLPHRCSFIVLLLRRLSNSGDHLITTGVTTCSIINSIVAAEKNRNEAVGDLPTVSARNVVCNMCHMLCFVEIGCLATHKSDDLVKKSTHSQHVQKPQSPIGQRSSASKENEEHKGDGSAAFSETEVRMKSSRLISLD